MAKHTIRTKTGSFKGERMTIRRFTTQDAMHKFLNTGDNANHWRETMGDETKLSPGKYAYAGGQWHNVRKLDASVLAHI